MKFHAVTTYAQRHWEQHAKRCVETFEQHWRDVPLIQHTDETLLAGCEWLADFKKRHAHRPTANYRMDAVRFAHKIAAIDLANRFTNADVLVWIDADCVTHGEVTPAWLERMLRDGDFGYLRRASKYPECGFMMFRRNDRGMAFIDHIIRQYEHDKLFQLPEWHDSFVIDFVRHQREKTGMLRCQSLSGHAERTHHPLVNGPLGERLDHLKGPRKGEGKSYARDMKVRRTEGYWADRQPAPALTNEQLNQRRKRLRSIVYRKAL